MSDYPALSDEAREALEAFATKYAKAPGGWKEHLSILWSNGGDTEEYGGALLRLIRNRFGPTWLIDVYAPLWRPDLPDYHTAVWEDGRLLEPAPGVALWSGKAPPPPVGETVRVTVNRIGEAVVTGYFVEDKWLGVIVRKPDGELVHVFGVDLAPGIDGMRQTTLAENDAAARAASDKAGGVFNGATLSGLIDLHGEARHVIGVGFFVPR